ncbi:MAG: toprim domain-containing protein [Alphaproteobacteria bacterium]
MVSPNQAAATAGASDLARRLAREAEAVCRHYLPHGCRRGRYWVTGDVDDTPGRSLFIRLSGPDNGPGAAGRWSDAATGEHGDLLDLIARRRRFSRLADTIAEARVFLALPRRECADTPSWHSSVRSGSPEAARRLFALGRPVPGTPAEAYLRARRITARLDWPALRFHPSVWYRESEAHPREAWPALLAAVTDAEGVITGIQRSWLDRYRPAKAPIADPRRALGCLLGNGVRFGRAIDVAIAGEGIETMLALASVMPSLPLIAALSANHLAALAFAPCWRRLYVARDNDMAGRHALERLRERAQAASIEVRDLAPVNEDFNADLCILGPAALLAPLAPQLVPTDLARFAADQRSPA